MYEYDYSKLKGKIRELNLTQEEYAKNIGISLVTLQFRLENKRPFTQTEIAKTMYLFNEPIENIHNYFFSKKVQKNRTG